MSLATKLTDKESRRWLEFMTSVQKRAMYHPPASFIKATKLADHDWVTFGQAVIDIDVRRDQPSLMYRNHHLKDFAWSDNSYGETDTIYRKWKPTVRQLVQMFGTKVHASVTRSMDKDPEKKIDCFHIMRPREGLEDPKDRKTPRAPWTSIYIDRDNEHVMEATPYFWNRYVIPRWQTIVGSPYGWSPATGPGLNDAKTLQTVMRILLEAGEKAVDPPLIATEEALRSDLNIYSGGVTYVEENYDQRSGDPIRPLDLTGRSLPIGFELADRHNLILHQGFFLDKMRLPQNQGEMTAYEVRKRLEEHIRAASPLLAPAEDEYNAKICERTFEILRVMQAFGPEDQLPEVLQGQQIRYEFQSPIREMSEELKSQKLMETIEIVTAAASVDETQIRRVNWTEATYDALKGKKLPAEWLLDDKEFAQVQAQLAEQKKIQEGMAAMQQAAQAAPGLTQAAQIADQAQQ